MMTNVMIDKNKCDDKIFESSQKISSWNKNYLLENVVSYKSRKISKIKAQRHIRGMSKVKGCLLSSF